jgi:hypothetical protein
VCECCKKTNRCLAVVSYAEFMALDLRQTEALLRCGSCIVVRHVSSVTART